MEIQKKPSQGSVLGGTLLVTGCCIGAAMLGLPVLTGLAGFRPSLIMFVLSWLFMVTTGLLLLEVNLWFREEVNIVSMAGKTLGKVGEVFAWGLFMFLFYSLMVAYVSGSGILISDFGQEIADIMIPPWVGSLATMGFFGVLIYMGTQVVDQFNRILMVGLVVSYFILVMLGIPHVNMDYLKYTDWSAARFVLPAMIISFGYHNLIPSLKTYMNGDVKRLRLTIILGSAMPLLIYIFWEYVILGLVPVEGEGGFREALGRGDMATRALRTVVGRGWVVDLAEYFAFFAIVTSFLAVALSFVDFLADGLHIPKVPKGKFFLCALTLIPPFVFALVYPSIFLVALSYAGAFGAVILFGIMPAAMVWSGRYIKKLGKKEIVPGGKLTLVLVILFSLAVILLEVMRETA